MVIEAVSRLRKLLPVPELTSLRLRDYRFWWVSSSATMMNQFVNQMALAWWVKTELDSPAMVGTIILVFGIPSFLFLLPAGLLADRWDRKSQLQVAQAVGLIASLTMALLITFDQATLPFAMALAFLSGSTVAFSYPARQALIRQLVPRPLLANAVVLGSLSGNTSQLVAPAIAGLLIVSIGINAAFFFIAMLLLVGLMSLGAMRIPTFESTEGSGTGRLADDGADGAGSGTPGATAVLGARPSLAETVGGGFQFLWRTKPLLVMMMLYFVGGIFVSGPIRALLPVLIDDVWGRDASALGIAFSVQAVASLITGLYLTKIGSLKNKGGYFSLALMIAPSSMALYSISPEYSLALVFFFSYGIAVAFFSNMSQTILQGNTPPELLGRVVSVYQLCIMGMQPFGAFLAGVLAGILGAPLTGVVCGAIAFTASFGALILAPRYRRLQ